MTLPGTSGPPGASALPPRNGELFQRVLSGVVLAAVAAVCVWAGSWIFGLMLAIVAGVASWEWCRIVRGVEFDRLFVLHAGAVCIAALAAVAGYGVPAAVGLAMVAIVMQIVQWRVHDLFTGLGVLVTGFPVICLAFLRSDPTFGLAAVMFVFVVVWATDIGGYAFGRTFGGPKLWPDISPAKTWSGAAGGLLLAACAGFIVDLSLGGPDSVAAVLAALMLGLAAELGDLAESALKRRFGRKDASNLIPGHGGVLDRVDGLMAATVAAAVLAVLRNPMHPGAGLLFWP